MSTNTGVAAQWDTVLQQGATFARTLQFDIDVSAVNFRAQMRRRHESTNYVASFGFTRIDDHTVVIGMDPNITEQIPAGDYVFDVEMYTASDAYVARILEGRIEVTPEVTR